MTDLEWLAVALAAMLGLEAVVRLPFGSSAVLDLGDGRGVWRQAARWSHFARRGFLFAPLLPPLATLIRAHPWPVALSPKGVLDGSLETESASATVLSWDDVVEVDADGPWLLLTPEVRVDAGSAGRADWCADRLAELAELSGDDRERAIGELIDASFDREALAAELERLRAARRPLTVLSHITWGLFAALLAQIVVPRTGAELPVVVAVLTGLGLAALLLLLHVVLVLLFHLAVPRAAGGAVRDHWTRTLLIAVSPLAGVHATTALARDVAMTFHPVAVVGLLANRIDAVECARRHVLRLRHPPLSKQTTGEAAREVEEWYRKRLRIALEQHVEAHVAPVEELLEPPRSDDADVAAYCPHCRATFTRTEGGCSDCEIELTQYRDR